MTIMSTGLYSGVFKRSYCTYKNVLTSQYIRSRFLDYFVEEKDHKFIKSIPVASYFDSTVPFINAGMCQFKRVFLGEEEIDCDKAANTQKCIRIGGKHNDLNLIGNDSSHHTFFEMLGNWSFGAYHKNEACVMAWQLLTSAPYNISPNRLFVTYFGGDKNLNLPADDEVREIWLKLGVPSDRILPFGMQENFWEMGLTGPCGTCTEIHVALDDSVCSRSDLVNKNNPLLAELWNVVFIEFNKTENSLNKLPKEFIDTGMGFERLVSLLQGKSSNYDTDLFVPLFHKISQISKAPVYSGSFNSNNLDSFYRCLADFSRMITVAISDNIYPDLNPKLKRVLRKALYIAKYKFDCNEPSFLLNELSSQVAEIYQDIFPEIGNNLEKIKIVVQNEDRHVQNLTNQNFQKWNHKISEHPILESFSFIEYPGLVHAYNFILSETKSIKKGDYVPVSLIHYLYDTHGLDQPIVEKLMDKLEFKVNWDDVGNYLGNVKEISRMRSCSSSDDFMILQKSGIKTDNSLMHSFTKSNNMYNFPEIKANLVAIVKNNSIQSIAKPLDEFRSTYLAEVEFDDEEEFGLIFDRSPFFCGENGQYCDLGEITISAGIESVPLNVVKVKKIKSNIIHFVEPRNKENKIVLKSGVDAVLKINATYRLDLMRNYTALHMLYKVLEDLYPLVYHKSNVMLPHQFKLKCRALGKKFSFAEDKQFIEERMKKYINEGLSIERITLKTSREVFSLPHLKLCPGVTYPPSDLQAILFIDQNGNCVTSDFCAGVHLLNVKDVEKFEIVNVKWKECSDLIISCRVGQFVGTISEEEQLLEKDSKEFADRAKILSNTVDITVGQILDFNDELSKYLFRVANEVSKKKYPQTERVRNSLLMFTALQKDISKRLQKFTRDSVVRELASRIQRIGTNQKFAIYFCFLDSMWFVHESFKVDIVYRNDFPTMMFHYSVHRNLLTAICYVPKSFVKKTFDANLWLRSTCEVFGFEVCEEEDMTNYCFMTKRIPEHKIYEFIEPLFKVSTGVVKQFVE